MTHSPAAGVYRIDRVLQGDEWKERPRRVGRSLNKKGLAGFESLIRCEGFAEGNGKSQRAVSRD